MSNNLQALAAFMLTLTQKFLGDFISESHSLSIFRKHNTQTATAEAEAAPTAAQYAQNAINLTIQINLNSNKLQNGIVNSQVNTEFSMKMSNNNKWL